MTAQITADAIPIVVGKRFGAHGLRIACPFCKGPRGVVKYHEHGTGYQKGCAYRKSHPAILMVQSAQDRAADDIPGPLNAARKRGILVQ